MVLVPVACFEVLALVPEDFTLVPLTMLPFDLSRFELPDGFAVVVPLGFHLAATFSLQTALVAFPEGFNAEVFGFTPLEGLIAADGLATADSLAAADGFTAAAGLAELDFAVVAEVGRGLLASQASRLTWPSPQPSFRTFYCQLFPWLTSI